MRKMFSKNQIEQLAKANVEEMRQNGELAVKNEILTFTHEIATEGVIEMPSEIVNKLMKYRLIYISIETPEESDEWTNGVIAIFDNNDDFDIGQLIKSSLTDYCFINCSLLDGEIYFDNIQMQVGDTWKVVIIPIL